MEHEIVGTTRINLALSCVSCYQLLFACPLRMVDVLRSLHFRTSGSAVDPPAYVGNYAGVWFLLDQGGPPSLRACSEDSCQALFVKYVAPRKVSCRSGRNTRPVNPPNLL